MVLVLFFQTRFGTFVKSGCFEANTSKKLISEISDSPYMAKFTLVSFRIFSLLAETCGPPKIMGIEVIDLTFLMV